MSLSGSASNAASTSAGSSLIVVVMMRACAGDRSPSACAAAACANNAGNTCPLTVRRGPNSRAARTRPAASRASMRSNSTNRSAVERRAYSPATPRCVELADQRVAHRRRAPLMHLPLLHRIHQLRG